MKKQFKRIIALMLSLVMVFGCIPSFNNIASATGISIDITFDGIDSIRDVKIGDPIPVIEFKEGSSDFEVRESYIYKLGEDGGKVTGTFTECGDYYAYIDLMVVNEVDVDRFTFGGEELTLCDSYLCAKDTKKYRITSSDIYACLGFEITPTPIDEIEVLDNGTFDSTEFYFKTPDDANYEIAPAMSYKWYKEVGLSTPATEITDTNPYYTKLTITPKQGYQFEPPAKIFVDYGYIPENPTYTSSQITLVIAKATKTDRILDLVHKSVTSKADLAEIYAQYEAPSVDPDVLKSNDPFSDVKFGGEILPGCMCGKKYIGKYALQIVVKESGSLNYPHSKFAAIYKVILNGVEEPFDDVDEDLEGEAMYDFIFTNDIIVVKNKSSVKDRGYGEVDDADAVPEIRIIEIYDFSKNDGEIIFSGMNPGCLIDDVTPNGNLTSDVIDIDVLEYSEGDWIEPTTTNFEAGKKYRIISTLLDSEYEYKKIKINGTTYEAGEMDVASPNESGYNYYYSADGNFGMFLTYDFTAQNPSSGSSKKYKANDKEDTTEKITGTGKKGSKRTIIPEEGRKVTSVIVTDKNGNQVEVTPNEDGTYSFVQPASDVDIKVNYKNRIIELTIGSLDASVDDEKHQLDVVPKVVNDRTMLPIRFVAENLGAKVDWDEKHPDTVIITRGDTRIEITLGSDKAKVNGEEYILDSVAFAENDRTYLPVRFVSEKLNAIVEWNESHPMDVKIYERQ